MHNLVDNFINQNIENESMFRKDVINGAIVEMKSLNSKFYDYLFKVFACSYVNKTIVYNSMKYKKGKEKEKFREELSLNAVPEGFDEEKVNTIIHENAYANELVYETNYYSEVFSLIVENLELLRALNTLTERQKEIIYMCYVLDQEEAKIAKKFNVSLQAINKTKNQAIRKLRQSMGVVG